MHRPLVLLLLAALPAEAAARQGDTLPARDSVRPVRVEDLEVAVTRSREDPRRLPFAVHTLRGEALRRGQLTTGLDESLSRLPGVVVFNRHNYSLDQRISLRGAGSRANFGLRGVKVLVDGVPQTLPDGQSQLTNLELGIVDRVEVLPGASGALYGNASGGVIAFATEAPAAPFQQRLRLQGSSFGGWKAQSVTGARGSRASGLLALSWFETGGFRQHSAAEARQLVARGEYFLDGRSALTLRVAAADAPVAQHPGALTAAEYAVRRDSAAGPNILRGADKAVTQEQLALQYRWADGAGREFQATLYGLHRDLRNPLAAPPPSGTGPAVGTYSTIGRHAGGARVTGTLPLRAGPGALRLTAGVDLQAMRDDRRNERSLSGVPTGAVLADQRETVTELGGFAQARWEPRPGVVALGAARLDRLRFRVADRHLGDGTDNGGRRRFGSASGSLGVSVAAWAGGTVYGNVATSFESPTTTELVSTAGGTVGLNPDLGPQRTRMAELGVRGGARVTYTLAAFAGTVREAIVQAREQDGRAFFANAGRLRLRGIEAGAGLAAGRLRLDAAYTFASYRYDEYRARNGAAVDTLDGRRLPGVPRHFLRVTAALDAGNLHLELDQQAAGAVFADDRNTLEVRGWGAGTTALRVSGRVKLGRVAIEPFGAIQNLFDRRYVGSVTLNGVGGRVLEPAPGRNVLVGGEVGFAR